MPAPLFRAPRSGAIQPRLDSESKNEYATSRDHDAESPGSAGLWFWGICMLGGGIELVLLVQVKAGTDFILPA